MPQKLRLVRDNFGQTHSEFDHHSWEYPFWAHLVPKFKTVSKEIWYLHKFEYVEFHDDIHDF